MSMTARHLANLAPRPRYSTRRSRRPSRPSVIDFARAERQRLRALVDLDAGERARLLDQLDQRRAVLGVLPDGLVIENDAGDVLRHRLGRAEQKLAVVAPVVGGRLDADRVEALLDGAGGLVGRENAAARRHHGLRHPVELREVHRGSSLILRNCPILPCRPPIGKGRINSPAAPRRRAGPCPPATPGTRRRLLTRR